MRILSMREAINEALHTILESDSRAFLMGEDIARYGGQLRCSYGLFDKYGGERVRDTPISETAIVGGGVGAALVGMRPIVELSYIDFIGVSFDRILNQAAKIRYMYGGRANVPLVIRTQCGAGLGNGAQHSQSLEAILSHIPGLRVIMPSTPYDAKGLLLRAARDNNPVVFIEHKALYNKKGEVPEEAYEIEYGADIKKQGTDVTIISYSAMIPQALKAAEKLEKENNISAEVVDVRVLEPFDINTIVSSVRKTGHAVIVHEACRKGGFGAEIAAQIQETAFNELKSPIKRVAAPNVPVPYAGKLEKYYLPGADDIVTAVNESIKSLKV